jgi:hypothetical protein
MGVVKTNQAANLRFDPQSTDLPVFASPVPLSTWRNDLPSIEGRLRALSPRLEARSPSDGGVGVVKSLVGLACGPVVLVHTQKIGIQSEKPT